MGIGGYSILDFKDLVINNGELGTTNIKGILKQTKELFKTPKPVLVTGLWEKDEYLGVNPITEFTRITYDTINECYEIQVLSARNYRQENEEATIIFIRINDFGNEDVVSWDWATMEY